IIAPRCPGPDDGATNRRPFAVPAARRRTVTAGGRRSGRETKRWTLAPVVACASRSSNTPRTPIPAKAAPAPAPSSSRRVRRPRISQTLASRVATRVAVVVFHTDVLIAYLGRDDANHVEGVERMRHALEPGTRRLVSAVNYSEVLIGPLQKAGTAGAETVDAMLARFGIETVQVDMALARR